MREDWRRYVAPAAFLLAVTIAVVLIRSGVESGGTVAGPPTVPTTPRKHVATTTAVTTTTHGSTTTTTSAARAYWTVQAGDSFGVISSKTGVPVATIEQLNPNASSTSLFIGEKIRYR